jgi:hypothetical protein
MFAFQAANTAALLGKRVILNNLGIPTSATPIGLQSFAAMPGAYPIKSYKYWFTNICNLYFSQFFVTFNQ